MFYFAAFCTPEVRLFSAKIAPRKKLVQSAQYGSQKWVIFVRKGASSCLYKSALTNVTFLYGFLKSNNEQ